LKHINAFGITPSIGSPGKPGVYLWINIISQRAGNIIKFFQVRVIPFPLQPIQFRKVRRQFAAGVFLKHLPSTLRSGSDHVGRRDRGMDAYGRRVRNRGNGRFFLEPPAIGVKESGHKLDPDNNNHYQQHNGNEMFFAIIFIISKNRPKADKP